MKKIIITIIAIATMMTLASCGTEHETRRGYTHGSDHIDVTETWTKDDEVVKEKHYVIQYDSVEEAQEAFFE